MNKSILALAAILLSLGHQSIAGQPAAIPGAVGPVTIALTTQYEVGGFTNNRPKSITKNRRGDDYYKVLTNTSTLYKEAYSSVIKTGKYTNAEFIADLVASDQLASPASQWRLVYVNIPSEEIDGVFAVNRTGSSAVYLGGYVADLNLPFIIQYNNGYASNESDLTTITMANSSPVTRTYKGSYGALDTVSITLNTYSYARLTALSTSAQSYIQTTDYVHMSSSSRTTIGATNFTSVIGDDNDNYGVIYTGTISFGRLNSYSDTSVFVTAYNDYNNT